MGRGSGGLTGLRVRVDLKHIRRERDGRIYVRLRGRSIRLREAPGTEAFLEEYRRAIRLVAGPHPAGHRAVQGSLSWLCRQYFASAEFNGLASSSQAVRRRTLERICERDGNKPYARMESRHVRTLRDEKPGPEIGQQRS